MPQRDLYHETVRRALIADGWIITHDPLILPFGATSVYVDLGAEGPLAAEKGGRKIAVEVKSFLGASSVREMESALGLYVIYGFLLGRQEPDRTRYLALSDDTYRMVLETLDARDLLEAQGVNFLLFASDREGIVRWIE